MQTDNHCRVGVCPERVRQDIGGWERKSACGRAASGRAPTPRDRGVGHERRERIRRIAVADTVGYANPGQVRKLTRQVLALTGDVPVPCHFHDTRGLGLANVVAALDGGVRYFDSSLGGLGDSPGQYCVYRETMQL
jgi:hypothetical protein